MIHNFLKQARDALGQLDSRVNAFRQTLEPIKDKKVIKPIVKHTNDIKARCGQLYDDADQLYKDVTRLKHSYVVGKLSTQISELGDINELFEDQINTSQFRDNLDNLPWIDPESGDKEKQDAQSQTEAIQREMGALASEFPRTYQTLLNVYQQCQSQRANAKNDKLDDLVDAVQQIAAQSPTSRETTRYAGSINGDINLASVVDEALFETFGSRIRMDDEKSVLDSLNTAFVKVEEKNQVKYEWQPKSYTVRSQLGGAITGAQASLYTRATTAFEAAKPLLLTLKPLKPDFDKEDTEAIRSLVLNEFQILVDELGRDDGPNGDRVAGSFDRLLGINRNLSSGLLHTLKDKFGLNPNDINVIDEESNYTNYLIITDYIKGLETAWNTLGSQTFFGTQLIKLGKSFAAVAESVEETIDAMDANNLGRQEREVIRVKVPSSQGPNTFDDITINNGLDRIRDFATDEGPRLLRDAGKLSAPYVAQKAKNLQDVVNEIIGSPNLHPALQTIRVKRALGELAAYLKEIENRAKAI